MGSMPTNVLVLKVEGNTHVKNGHYLAAINCYDRALQLSKNESDAVPLLLNRAHARLHSQHYDAALADSRAVIAMAQNQPPEKALFRAGRALYGLQRWEEALAYFEELVALNAKNKLARRDVERCGVRLREQRGGEYDFGGMLEEAVGKGLGAYLDRGDFVGSVEVRDCEVRSHGRGLFTTKPVQAGELLLCEKAFVAVFAHADGSGETQEDEGDISEEENKAVYIKRRHELEAKAMVKLYRNPSLQAKFAELYPGPDWVDNRDEETGEPIVDEPFIQSRVTYNAFGFPPITHSYHYTIMHNSDSIPDYLAGSRGVWLKASFMNHSCFSTVRRSFIGDMIIFRAQRNIPADTELKFGYISGLERREERLAKLRKYGFECDCGVCEAEGKTGPEEIRRRVELVNEIRGLFEKGERKSLETYTALLNQLEETYVNPPSQEYRRAMITPLTNLITGCLQSGLEVQVIELTYRLLRSLGFEIQVTMTSFKVLQWGFLIDEIIISLVDLCHAYKVVNPVLVRDAEATAKKCYLIMCGEDVSWEEAYGAGGLHDKAQEGVKRTEDLVEGVNGLEFV